MTPSQTLEPLTVMGSTQGVAAPFLYPHRFELVQGMTQNLGPSRSASHLRRERAARPRSW